ncbi:BamA/TamA family outer membrane protein [Solitalea lacus]|uniref:BamA/TamA family outer membrane protein n=1 Tax=Solitalea lacus TaxID=2911172 RepID=UPI001EDAF145|nr:BamA/TamA family outer membrane protein [Solitalea lacus]UKJ07417.1 BamA/TamA family outer membrane protein [Solitalea lacus]
MHSLLARKKSFFIILLSLFVTKTSFSQSLSNKTDTINNFKNSILPVPVIGSSQEKGFEFGLAAVYSFYLSKAAIDQRNSTIGILGTLTTKNQSKFNINGNLWTRNNDWHIVGDLKPHNFPNYFYGLGSDTKEADKDLINDNKFRINLDAEKQVTNSFYLGAGLWFLHEQISDKEDAGIYASSDLESKSGGNTTYLAFSATYDNRDVVNYPHRGAHLRFYIQNSFKALASDFNFILLTADARKYWKINPTMVLAVQGYMQSLQGSDKPFFLLPQMGGDQLMRGYYTGRYRDQNYIAAQGEIRFRPFAKRPDAGLFSLSRGVIAAFAGGGGVFSNGGFSGSTLKPTYGLGGRYIFDTRNRLTLRIDYGIGDKNPGEKRSSGFYISLNEAF